MKNIKGLRFGRLVVLEMVDSPKKDTRHGKWWLCKCDCGNTKIIMGVSLRTGKSKSCGCRNIATRFKRSGRTEINILFSSYRRSALDRKLVFDLSFEHLSKLIKQECFYCGCNPSQTMNYYKWTDGFLYNGIDRVDSDEGYVLSNCVTCCSTCNYAKRTLSTKQFYLWITNIFNNLKSKGVL